MNNPKRQEQLDKQRWIRSEKAKCDMGGTFDYCAVCEQRSAAIGTHYYTATPHCNCSYEQRKQDNTCAKAYNKYYRKKKLNKN